MLVAPARFLDFPLGFGHGLHRLFVFINDEAIAAVADRVRFDLNATTQSLLQDRLQRFLFNRQKPGSVRLVRLRREQRRAARAKRSIGVKFDRADRQPIAIGAHDWAILKKPLRFEARR